MNPIYILLSILIGGVIIWFAPPPVVTDTVIVTIADETETHFLSEPVGSQIKKVYGFYNNVWNGGTYRFVSITDTDISRIYESHIDFVDSRAKQFFSNELERIQSIKHLYGTIDESILNSISDSSGRDSTISYITIAKELNRLGDIVSSRRVVLIYSDLMENSTLINLYDTTQFHLLKEQPDSVHSMFQMEVELTDLSGIEVKLIYEPINAHDNIRYRVIAGFYKDMLERKGATVVVEANISDL
ncbi:hypothetical protein COB64_04310 [Candidatus Wolfebacteria bacterium]|nr:MAG: hypothetical protein COB64_04310 [Candidatus Wolfebacteria bacterium]